MCRSDYWAKPVAEHLLDSPFSLSRRRGSGGGLHAARVGNRGALGRNRPLASRGPHFAPFNATQPSRLKSALGRRGRTQNATLFPRACDIHVH